MPIGIWTVLSWAIPIAMVPIVASRHSPTAAIAWLLLIFFQPLAGLVVYLLVGENRVLRRLAKTYGKRIREMRSFEHLAAYRAHIFRSFRNPGLPLETVTERLACPPAVRGNEVELLDDGHRVIDRLIADIDQAENHVHLLFYIFQNDAVGRRVAEALARAAKRGLRARLVVDAFGSRSLARELGQWLKDRGIAFHTIMSINPFRRHHTRLDLRNHRKLVVIDGKIAYTGSQNIEVKDYDHGRPSAWHDLMVRIAGPAVLHLQVVFVEDWYLASDTFPDDVDLFPEPSWTGDVPIQVIPTAPTDPNTVLRDILMTAIGAASESVVITSPYFIPDEPFRVALHLAALRGVRIDLLIPRHSDHLVVGAVARAYVTTLIESGVNIHFHRGLLHAKTMTVDRTIAVIGTANFDRRSFFLHSELSLLLYGEDITERLRMKQAEYMAQSVPVDPLRWKRRSVLKRTRDNVLKILSPIL